ncbi:hypothetical protein BGY98DRAFT_936064 [Russula aff. rugulosa BPL654]|nr:hypothetical protein BGY98DRAFT_936064 [Russula aff. rugulosa BPL654]
MWTYCYQGERGTRAAALSWAKMHVYNLGITTKRAQDPLRVPNAMIDVRVHLPAGARKKGGLSAGVAMITLRGRVSPVGGIKGKVLGAHRAGAKGDPTVPVGESERL